MSKEEAIYIHSGTLLGIRKSELFNCNNIDGLSEISQRKKNI